ncbi:MAG: hypothetical protein C5B54_11615 [Acidobacteria bacterium]|nr:MAG: hypothetical protein C5B54_11615 [Acidobacteriota bacterium]
MFTRISTKILVLFVLNVLVWVSALGLFFYLIAARSLEKQVDSSLSMTATVLASQWDGALLLALHPGMEEAPLYRSFSERLKRLKERTNVEGIYVALPDRTNIVSSESGYRIGQSLPRLDLMQRELREAMNGRTNASGLVTVNDKTYKSALAPIYSADKVVAVLMVDMSPQYLIYLHTFRNSLLLFTVIALLACVLSAKLFSRTITTPISRMVQQVEQIGKAQFEFPLQITGSDELSKLGASIETMRQNILHRDAQMKMMLSGIAHEIRNPLGGMELFAGILEKEKLDGEQRQYLQKIQSEIQNLKKLLNEFLDFARPPKLEYENIALSNLISEIHAIVDSDLKQKEANWIVEIPAELNSLYADRAKLKQALLNLYRNAFQALPDGGEISSRVQKNGSGIILELSNSLISPIDREIANKIFEPFFTTKEKGIGLGLPLAKRIIESHGGELKFIATDEARATFAIKLPVGANP